MARGERLRRERAVATAAAALELRVRTSPKLICMLEATESGLKTWEEALARHESPAAVEAVRWFGLYASWLRDEAETMIGSLHVRTAGRRRI